MAIHGTGRYRGAELGLRFSGDPLGALRDPAAAYGLELELALDGTALRVAGTVRHPLAMRGLDLMLAVSGPDPRRLYPLLGIPFPTLPPYTLEGRLEQGEGEWRVSGLQGRVGDSDLSGSLVVETGGTRPRVVADLSSRSLDLDDLGGLVGLAPGTGEGEIASAAQRQRAREGIGGEGVLPAKPVVESEATGIGARVDYHGRRVLARGLPLDDLTIGFRKEDGWWRFAPLDFGLGGGHVRATIELPAGAEEEGGVMEVRVSRVDLRRALAGLEVADESVGLVGGSAKLWVKGRSVADLLGSADGGAMLLMTGGRLDALLVELAGLDAGEALLAWLGGRDPVPIDCAYVDLKARDGTLTVVDMVVDTRDTLFRVDGSIHLDSERLDLTLHPYPKDVSGPAARTPLHLGGRFAAPQVALKDDAGLAARGLAAGALGALAGPVGILLPLLETGGDAESGLCTGLVERIQQARGGA